MVAHDRHSESCLFIRGDRRLIENKLARTNVLKASHGALLSSGDTMAMVLTCLGKFFLCHLLLGLTKNQPLDFSISAYA